MSQKTVLGIDTATLTASVAVIRGDELLAAGQSSVNTHSQRLLGLVDEALRAASLTLADLDGIAIGAGPGSFTGLRIGMATAKGLAFAADKPLWAVSSLAAMAGSASADGDAYADRADTLVVPILDARRMEIFAGFYRLDGSDVESLGDELVIAPKALGAALSRVFAATGLTRAVALGDGVGVYREELTQLSATLGSEGELAFIEGPDTPPAAAVARLAVRGEQRDLVIDGAPSYIRLSEAEIKYPNGNPGGAFRTRATKGPDSGAG